MVVRYELTFVNFQSYYLLSQRHRVSVEKDVGDYCFEDIKS